MKTASTKFNMGRAGDKIAGFIWAHYGGILLSLFFLSIAVWAFVFWRYGIAAPQPVQNFDARIIKVKEADLRKITDNISERDKIYDSILEKTFTDPFIKPSENPTE